MSSSYILNPGSTSYSAAYGGVPGQLGLPPSIWEQLNSNVPGYSGLTQGAVNDIGSMMRGELSPGTESNIANTGAARGVAMGQPNSPLVNSMDMSLTGTTSNGLEQQGVNDYGTFTGTVGAEQQNPALMNEIATQNAVDASAPNPAAAAAAMMAEMMAMRGPQGGSSMPAGTVLGGGGSPSGSVGNITGMSFGGLGLGSFGNGAIGGSPAMDNFGLLSTGYSDPLTMWGSSDGGDGSGAFLNYDDIFGGQQDNPDLQAQDYFGD